MADPLETLIDAAAIARRIAELGREVRESVGDRPILCIGVLKGSFVFLADLMRAIPGDVRCDFLGVSSYVGTRTSGEVRILHDLRAPIEGWDVLLVEDVVDTGLTLAYLLRTLTVRAPRSLRVATLLDKPSRRQVDVKVDHVGFSIPDSFVVGYGLDHDERFRNRSDIAIYHGSRKG